MQFIICTALYFAFSYLLARIGANRKFGFWGYLFASLLLSPAIGCLLVIASDPIVQPTAEPAAEPSAAPEKK